MRRKRLPRYTKAGIMEADEREMFARVCLHFVGNDESYGKPLILEDWSRRYVWRPVFAAGKVRPDGRFERRYRRALIGVERGIGKTVIACAMLLAEATMSPVYNGQYGLVADSTQNVRNAYQILVAMVRLSPELSKAWRPYADQLVNIETGAWIRIFPNKWEAVQGYHFNMVICDEIHTYRDDRIWKAVTSGQRGIFNALALAITTASDRRSGFAWKLYSETAPKDPRCWLYWIGIDDSDDPLDERCWRKVMVSSRVSMEQMRDQLATLGPRDFERYALNRFPLERTEAPFMRRSDLDACLKVSAEIDPREFLTVGIDGATNGDTLAVVEYQRTPDGIDAFREWEWDRPGQLGVYDLTDVGDVVTEIVRRSDRTLVCCDPARLQFLANWLERERGLEVYAFAQTPRLMCPASETLARSVRGHTAAMSATPVLAEHCANAIADESKAYGRRLSSRRHGQGSDRIDAAVAAAMAMSAYDTNVGEQQDWSGGVFSVEL